MADKQANKGAKKGKNAKPKGKSGEEAPPYSSIATHPRASMRVRQAKGWGGLLGFALAAALSLKAAVPMLQVLERAVLFGVIGYLVAWTLSVFVWRQLMIAEQRAAIDQIKRRREASREAADADDHERRPATTSGESAGAG